MTRILDDGQLARELQQQIYQGDPEDGGVVWPRIAEISLLGGIGCGKLAFCSVSCFSSIFTFSLYFLLGFVRIFCCHEPSGAAVMMCSTLDESLRACKLALDAAIAF